MAKMKVEATEIPVTATPEWLASQVVVDGRSNGFADGVVLRCPNDRQVATIPHSKIPFCRPGQELVAVRAWLTQQIEAGYKAGVEAGRAEGQEHIAGRVAAARGDALTAHANDLRAALGVTDPWDGCLAMVRDLVAKDKAAEGRMAKAHSDAVTMCADQLREALGTTLGWRGCVDAVRDLVAKDKARIASEDARNDARNDARAEAFKQVLRWCGVDLSDDPAGEDPAFLERAAGDAVVALRIATAKPPVTTDAAAESAAIDGLVGEAIRQRGNDLDGHDRSGRWCLHLGDTRVDTRHKVACDWLRPWLLAAWARGVAYGQQPDAPPVLVDHFGVAAREQVVTVTPPGEVGATRAEAWPIKSWYSGDGVYEVTLRVPDHLVARMRDATGRSLRVIVEGVPAASAAREQVAAERAADAAAVAPGEEALAAAREEGRRAGIEEATSRVNEYLGRRLARLSVATKSAEEARKTASQRNAEVAQLTVETETLREALDVLDAPKETP